jgi:Leu/Phe-tRNA-protein transferase
MKEFEKWWENFNRLTLPADEFDFARLAWKASREELLKEIDKRFVNIIKLCDHPMYDKKDIRQVANDACSFIYLLQGELSNK